MKSFVLFALFASFALTGCFFSPAPPDYWGVTVSPLPPVVELCDDPYYYQDGYHYYYKDNNWHYSRSRNGPWENLPRSHWPKEVRRKGQGDDQDRDRADGRGWERDNFRDYWEETDRR